MGEEHAKIAAKLLQKNGLLIYVACDPTSVARDSKVIIECGLQPINIAIFDMFPQTIHYETIIAFVKN